MLQEPPFPFPELYPCAGFDEAREFELVSQRKVVVLSCNRDGLLALYGPTGQLVATHNTLGKPILVTLFAYYESGRALDKALMEEYSWGTNIRTRDQVLYRFTDVGIQELWREPILRRAGGAGLHEERLDGYVRVLPGAYEGHGPILIYGAREGSRGPYRERLLEIREEGVKAFTGELE
jgi:hypothetical protein